MIVIKKGLKISFTNTWNKPISKGILLCGHGGYGKTGPLLHHLEVGAMLHFATLAIIACADINQLH